jgi:hypothetical protein
MSTDLFSKYFLKANRHIFRLLPIALIAAQSIFVPSVANAAAPGTIDRNTPLSTINDCKINPYYLSLSFTNPTGTITNFEYVIYTSASNMWQINRSPGKNSNTTPAPAGSVYTPLNPAVTSSPINIPIPFAGNLVYNYVFVRAFNGSEHPTDEGTYMGACAYSSYTPGTANKPTVAVGEGQATVSVSAGSDGDAPTSYSIQAYDSNGNVVSGKTCTVSGSSGSCTITGLTNGSSYTFKATATNSVGTSAQSVASDPATPIDVAPTVSSVTSSTTNGSYRVGQTIPIRVTFDQSVVVTGIPQLALETGSPDQTINYTSGSGSSTLIFNYIIYLQVR